MKETIRRALRTFIQAAVGYIATNLVCIVSSDAQNFDYIKTALGGLCVSAIAAGLAAIMNMPKNTTKTESDEHT